MAVLAAIAAAAVVVVGAAKAETTVGFASSHADFSCFNYCVGYISDTGSISVDSTNLVAAANGRQLRLTLSINGVYYRGYGLPVDAAGSGGTLVDVFLYAQDGTDTHVTASVKYAVAYSKSSAKRTVRSGAVTFPW